MIVSGWDFRVESNGVSGWGGVMLQVCKDVLVIGDDVVDIAWEIYGDGDGMVG